MNFIDPAQDRWQALAPDDALAAPAPFLLLTFTQWQAARDHWPAQAPVGVVLANDADVEDLAVDLQRLSLVALQFPKWSDGRAYSQARLLRSRFHFAGEVRATGEVLLDMLPLLRRTGFDAVQLRADQDMDAARRALGFFAEYYQGDVLDNRPRFARNAAGFSQ